MVVVRRADVVLSLTLSVDGRHPRTVACAQNLGRAQRSPLIAVVPGSPRVTQASDPPIALRR